MKRVLVVGLALVLTACGRPSGPVEVDADLVPFEVGRSPSPSPGAEVRTITVYLVRAGHLEPVGREIASAAPDAEAAIGALLQGPTPQEREAGLGSAIPPVTRLLSVTVLRGVAEVDLAEEFQGPATPGHVLLRVAQVVWTLVALPDVSAVRFSIDGVTISVPTEAEQATDRPVTAADYAGLAFAPPSPSPPTTPTIGVSEP